MADAKSQHTKCPSESDSHAKYTLLNDADLSKRMEIALETVSPWTLRSILTLWYGVLAFGLLMIRLDLHMQWECMDFFTGEPCRVEEIIPSIEYQHSGAVGANSYTGETNHIMKSRWHRFPHLLIETSALSQKESTYVNDAITETHDGGEKPEDFSLPMRFEITLRGNHKKELFTYQRNVTRSIQCVKGQSRCGPVLLPVDVPGNINVDELNVQLQSASPEVIAGKVKVKSSIGFLYQKKSYTLLGVFLRYGLLVLSTFNLLHFFSQLGLQCLFRSHSRTVLVEQLWAIILQVFFILYANPFHLSCVLRGVKTSFKNSLLEFIEFHIADYFSYVVLTWNLVLVNCARFIPRRLPRGTHLCCVLGLLLMVALDCLLVLISKVPWSQTAHDFELNFSENSWPVRYVLFLLLAVQYLYFVVGFLLAFRLYFKLYKAPYFETRTQQLSFRLFVFVMWLHYLYRIIQTAALHKGTRLSSLLSYHRSHQMSELLIAFVYTQIATFCYSPARHNDNTPPPPTSSLWKRVVWTDAWYQWLRQHGGTLYFFNTRSEEEKFRKIQTIANIEKPDEKVPRPVQFVEGLIRKLAYRFTNILTLNRLTRDTQRGFFCLEKAIECFNISWEVYFKIPEKKSSETPKNATVTDVDVSEENRSAKPSAETELRIQLRDGESNANLREMHTEQYGFRLWKAFLFEEVQAVICEDDRTIIIAFRGTSNRKNIKYDMQFSRSNIEVGTKNFLLDLFLVPCVHSGFNTLWKKIEKDLLNEIEQLCAPREPDTFSSRLAQAISLPKLEPWRVLGGKRGAAFPFNLQPSAHSGKGKEIIITGHSLGGAIAHLCAYSIANRFQVSPAVYTFGSPRIGNTRFRQVYDEIVPNTFRIVNQSDVVSRFNIMMDNPHVGCEIAIDRYGNCICSPTFIERILRPWSRGIGLRHHLLGSYGQSLDAVSERHGSTMRVFSKKNE